jgi:apolipoprotein N-acyltransferase
LHEVIAAVTRPRRIGRVPVRSLLTRVLVCAVAGVAAGLAFEPLAWFYLLPFAIAGATVAFRGVRLGRAFLLGAVFGTAFMLVLLPWVRVIGVYAWVPLSVAEGLFYGLAGLATAATARVRLWPVWAACAWVGVEMLRGSFPFGGFPWGRLAFASVDTPVAPLMAYVGTAGVTFVIALVGTTLAWVVPTARRTPVRAVLGLAACCALASAAAPFAVNSGSMAPGLQRVTVAAVQGNVPGIGLHAFAEQRAVLDNHVAATLAFAKRIRAGLDTRPAFMVWPENSSDIDPYTDPVARASIGDAVRAVGAPLLMGAVVGDRAPHGEWFNRAIVWSRAGQPGAYYNKIHPVPFGEYIPFRSFFAPRFPALDQIPADMYRGRRPGLLQVGPARTGVLMCFEVAYDGLLRNLVGGGAQVLVVPTNNATYTGTGQILQQFAMSRLRAIETGRYVVVASTNGISGLIAPDGRVIAHAPVRSRTVLEGRVALTTRVTAAMRFGAWIERGLAAAGLVALLWGIVVGRRARRSAQVGGNDSSDAPVEPPAGTQRPGRHYEGPLKTGRG